MKGPLRIGIVGYGTGGRWLTPLFQSERDTLAAMRDRLFHPLTRMPGASARGCAY